MSDMVNPEEEEDEEEPSAQQVVVSGSGCGVGVRMRVTRMCVIMGWWPEGSDDHVSLLTSECI